MLAPEVDPAFSPELKELVWRALQRTGVEFAYEHFSGVGHACFARGDEGKVGEREVMGKGKKAAVVWDSHAQSRTSHFPCLAGMLDPAPVTTKTMPFSDA